MGVHRDFTVLSGVGEEGDEELFRLRVRSDQQALGRQLGRLRKRWELRCCYEASSCGLVVYHWLQEWLVSCEVVAPSLTPIHVAVRSLVRCREAQQQEVTRWRHRLLKFLPLHGLVYGDGHHWTKKHERYLNGLSFSGCDAEVYQSSRSNLLFQQSQLAALDRSLAELAAGDRYRRAVNRLRCCRGIDTLTAMVLISELDDPMRFAGAPALMSYLGLVPSEHSSGNSRPENESLRRVGGWLKPPVKENSRRPYSVLPLRRDKLEIVD